MIDTTDPAVVLIAWGLTWTAGQLGQKLSPKMRRSLPSVAVLIAVGARALIETASGEVLTSDTLLRALAAAGMAVWGHSQLRELAKAWQPDLGSTSDQGPPSDGGPPEAETGPLCSHHTTQ